MNNDTITRRLSQIDLLQEFAKNKLLSKWFASICNNFFECFILQLLFIVHCTTSVRNERLHT